VVQRPEPEPAAVWHGGGVAAWYFFSMAKGNRQGFASLAVLCVRGDGRDGGGVTATEQIAVVVSVVVTGNFPRLGP